MAAIATIFGGSAGFFSAMVALILFNASWLFALALWAMGGIAVAAMLVAFSLLPGQPTPTLQAEHA